jgi:non-ribosomal peptide synthetase component F
VAAVLGILRAGGSYVPLDPDYPPDRLRFIIKDAGLSTVLVQPGIQVPSQVRAIELSPDVFTGSEEPPAVPVLLENLAYIIYTSGSTGTPKGVMISHAAMLNTLTWLQDTFQLTPNDVVAHKTSISFTDSIWELLWPLMAGAQIAVIEENATQFPRLLVERMSRRRVTSSIALGLQRRRGAAAQACR